MKKSLTFLLLALISITLWGQPSKEYITVYAQPDHSDWVYELSEDANFTLFAIKENSVMPNIEIEYSYGPEKLDPIYTGKVTTDKNGFAKIKVKGRKEPGFTTVKVWTTHNGTRYQNMTNIGYEPYKIKPTTTLPDDFKEFWDNELAKASKVPMLTRVEYVAEQSDDKVDVYNVRVQSYKKGNYIYGVLSVPKSEGKKAAILRLPGAAVRSFSGPNSLAYEGFIVFEIGVHGIPVDHDPEMYRALSSGPLGGYATIGLEDKNTFYYKRVYLGCVRAIDYLCSREDVDSERIAVYGGSQGGMLSIVTAALDKRVSAMICYFPAFCDVTGYYYGRSGGWPHLFRNKNESNLDAKIETSKYYDTVNFARFVEIEGFYTWGFNDIVCCPTSTFSAYNVITAPKKLELVRDAGHWVYPEYVKEWTKWLKEKLSVK